MKFKAEFMSGHKDSAVEVPFDPVKEWNIPAKPLWRGRRGHAVNATINDVQFESCIVPRQKKLFMLIDAETAKTAGLAEGDVVKVAIEPCAE